jgi:hypothetical protein
MTRAVGMRLPGPASGAAPGMGLGLALSLVTSTT